MAGVDSAGLGEVLQNVLARFPDSDKARLVKVRLFFTYSRHPVNLFVMTAECIPNRHALRLSGPDPTPARDPPPNTTPRNAD
jgi:hypothetical protein